MAQHPARARSAGSASSGSRPPPAQAGTRSSRARKPPLVLALNPVLPMTPRRHHFWSQATGCQAPRRPSKECSGGYSGPARATTALPRRTDHDHEDDRARPDRRSHAEPRPHDTHVEPLSVLRPRLRLGGRVRPASHGRPRLHPSRRPADGAAPHERTTLPRPRRDARPRHGPRPARPLGDHRRRRPGKRPVPARRATGVGSGCAGAAEYATRGSTSQRRDTERGGRPQ